MANLIAPRDMGSGDELNPADVDLDALDEDDFDSGPFGGRGFGGGSRPPTHHANRMGALEGTPHGAVHVAVGGYMLNPDTAALDPIFWLHHANIDRLWEGWLEKDAIHENPKDVTWLTEPFDFLDHKGAPISLTAADVLDTTKLLHGYVYEGTQAAAGAVILGDLGAPAQGDDSMATTVPEMVGATAGPVKLGSQAINVGFTLAKASGPVASVLDSGTVPDVFLNFENVTARQLVNAYDVYVNVPSGDSPQQHPEQHAGVLPMFGVVNASTKDKGGTGDGLNYTFRITKLVKQLTKKHAWQWDDIQVTLVPRDQSQQNADLKVGRISVYLK
jgi:tyrosinase